MTFTPTKNTGKRKGPPSVTTSSYNPDYKFVAALRDEWLAKLPAEIDTAALYWSKTDAESDRLAFDLAGNARVFMEWTSFQPREWQPYGGYDQRLARVCAWLAQQPESEVRTLRANSVALLLEAHAGLQHYLAQDKNLIFDTIPSLWMPDEEFDPSKARPSYLLNAPLPFLPIWEVREVEGIATDELTVRREVARLAEQFCVYSGLVTYFNDQIGWPLLQLEELPF